MANSVYIQRFGSSGAHGASEPWIRITGRIDAPTAAEILGFAEHDIPVLIRRGLLRPLGKPVPNAVKYFAAVYIWQLAEDASWLDKATRAVYDHWRTKNASRENAEAQGEQT